MNQTIKPDQGRKLFYGLFIFPLLILAGMILMVCSVVFLTHEEDTPESLIAAIKTGSERKRWQKASELSNELNRRAPSARDAALADDLAVMLADERTFDPKTRAYLAAALGYFPGPQTESALVRALEDPSDEVRFYALWTLGRLKARGCAPAIVPLLKSPQASIRVNAAYVLGAMGEASAAPAIEALLTDASTDVRWNAALALARLGYDSGYAQLVEMTDRRQLETSHRLDDARIESVMLNAIKGLALIRKAESIKILESISRADQSLKVRQAAMDALLFQKKDTLS